MAADKKSRDPVSPHGFTYKLTGEKNEKMNKKMKNRYGVLSSTTVACSGGTNYNSWSRLSTTGGGGGVNVPGLSAALTAGAVNFVS